MADALTTLVSALARELLTALLLLPAYMRLVTASRLAHFVPFLGQLGLLRAELPHRHLPDARRMYAHAVFDFANAFKPGV